MPRPEAHHQGAAGAELLHGRGKAEGEQHTDSVLKAQGPALQHRTSRQSRAPSTAPSKQREGVQIHTESSRNRRWRQMC